MDDTNNDQEDIVFLLKKRAEIRNQIKIRKSVLENKLDRTSELLISAASEIESLRRVFASENQKIESYAEELNIPKRLTLEMLINSHRYLRNNAIKSDEQLSKELNKIREIAKEDARKLVLNHEYISVEKLKRLSIAELMDEISDL